MVFGAQGSSPGLATAISELEYLLFQSPFIGNDWNNIKPRGKILETHPTKSSKKVSGNAIDLNFISSLFWPKSGWQKIIFSDKNRSVLMSVQLQYAKCAYGPYCNLNPDLKWCIHLRRSLYLYFNFLVSVTCSQVLRSTPVDSWRF